MVWYGMVWYGMVWYGVVWYGMDVEHFLPTEDRLGHIIFCIWGDFITRPFLLFFSLTYLLAYFFTHLFTSLPACYLLTYFTHTHTHTHTPQVLLVWRLVLLLQVPILRKRHRDLPRARALPTRFEMYVSFPSLSLLVCLAVFCM